jgi:hypothetical protein
MKNLFEAAKVEEVKERMTRLRPDRERVRGGMNPAPWMAHLVKMAARLRLPSVPKGLILQS